MNNTPPALVARIPFSASVIVFPDVLFSSPSAVRIHGLMASIRLSVPSLWCVF